MNVELYAKLCAMLALLLVILWVVIRHPSYTMNKPYLEVQARLCGWAAFGTGLSAAVLGVVWLLLK